MTNFTDRLTRNRGARTQYRCNHCRQWHDDRDGCPHCGEERPQPNEGLRAARLASALYDQANRAS